MSKLPTCFCILSWYYIMFSLPRSVKSLTLFFFTVNLTFNYFFYTSRSTIQTHSHFVSSVFRSKYKNNSHQTENWLYYAYIGCTYWLLYYLHYYNILSAALSNAAIHRFHFIKLLREEHEYQYQKSEESRVQLVNDAIDGDLELLLNDHKVKLITDMQLAIKCGRSLKTNLSNDLCYS
jgi:hypothetical protein